ncbi:selenide, water dikinase SelD [Lusitaniella coriacea LEGE 07157]|uniref:Selenide, water dikinase SelD n=1 Tax=Lusitaniella coriacea LEGE 07157 TaxID=945747 RepID=A0A8J7DYT5_9CYAN|nr:selenide, water dikinase SelD [Lusitaniella coriacea]MBE9117777.1 selenide, water dikinase SelD [Lusitaniella coriacea LEGE 07157]
MQQAIEPIVADLVLVGGGHSHAIALKMLGMKPIPGVRLTLISDTSHTPYSGMLPGHVAGFYSYDETHIDLGRLARFAGAQFYRDRAIGLNLTQNQVSCANRPPVAFDYLSIDIGSTPAMDSVLGADRYAIPAKPVPLFLEAWNRVIKEVQESPEGSFRVGIVGGGAGGVELALNMHQRLKNIEIHLFHRDRELLPNHNQWVRKRLFKILQQRGVCLHLSENVKEVARDRVICESGLSVKCDRVFWVTQASAPSWIEASGIQTNSRGFILIKETLQSTSHPHIFASGDIATLQQHPRPKAGVFAVRQGKPLFENLHRAIAGKPLKSYIPQKRILALIGTGDRRALASWGNWGWQSSLFWRWKDRIDRKFMRRFEDLPQMPASSTTKSQEKPLIYCAGCGSKVGSTTLQNVLNRLPKIENSNIIIGLDQPDDAAVIQLPPHQLLVHTIDSFSTLIDDPFVFGQIATHHSLSDIFAMGATPYSALVTVTIPHGIETKIEETLYQLLCGVTKVLQQCQTPLVGGHTTEGSELALGIACNGFVSRDKLWQKNGMKPEQVLVLTKAIGTGTLFAADMRYQAKGRWIEKAIESMLLSNQTAAKILSEYGTTACTDVTGFGLIGHLLEMVRGSDVAVELNLEKVPILNGAIETIQKGIISSLQPQNLHAESFIDRDFKTALLLKYPLLFDPQTSGGLLASLPREQADHCLIALQNAGYQQAEIIGRVMPMTDEKKRIQVL